MMMSLSPKVDTLKARTSPLEMPSPLEMTEAQFRALGHDLVDRIAGLLGSLRERAVAPAEPVEQVRAVLDSTRTLPEHSEDAEVLLNKAADLLFEHSLFN